MSESTIHRRMKAKAAGSRGKVEKRLKSGKILDAKSRKTATEIERSGNPFLLRKAAQRLKESNAPRKVLQVPQFDMKKATAAMREKRVKGTVKNMRGKKRISVPKK